MAKTVCQACRGYDLERQWCDRCKGAGYEEAAQPAESSDSRDDDAEFRAWREQQWSAGINPTERDAWMERARRERDLLASVATPAVDYTAQQQAEPSGKLDAPAQVGNTIFRAGVDKRLVIEAAQRRYQFRHNPTEDDKRIAAGAEGLRALMCQIEKENDAKSEFVREVEKIGQQAEPVGGEFRRGVRAAFDHLMYGKVYEEGIAEGQRRAAQSGQRAGVAEGWKLVPLEPTFEMQEAGYCAWDSSCAHRERYVYRAMIAAAPTPAAQGDQS